MTRPSPAVGSFGRALGTPAPVGVPSRDTFGTARDGDSGDVDRAGFGAGADFLKRLKKAPNMCRVRSKQTTSQNRRRLEIVRPIRSVDAAGLISIPTPAAENGEARGTHSFRPARSGLSADAPAESAARPGPGPAGFHFREN